MVAGNKPQSERTLPDLNTLDPEALKALVIAQHSELASRETEIESLKLLILKLKRMQLDRARRSLIRRSASSNSSWKTSRPMKLPMSRRLYSQLL